MFQEEKKQTPAWNLLVMGQMTVSVVADMRIYPAKYSSVKGAAQIEPVGQIWPNGEFGFCYRPEKGLELVFSEEWQGSSVGSALGSSELANSHSPPRGSGGISSYGRKLVRNCVEEMEVKFPGRLTFATLTLPSCSQEELLGYAADWSRIVKVFTQRIKRRLDADGLPRCIVSVTEVQSKRFEARGEFALHLHMIFVGRHVAGGWLMTPAEIRWMWASALGGVMCSLPGVLPECEFGAVENVQCVKKSASAYLSKYMSKGAGVVQEYLETVPPYAIPRSWYSVTTPLRRLIKRKTIRLPALIRVLDSMVRSGRRDLFLYLKPINLESEECGSVIIGWYGKLAKEPLDDLRDLHARYLYLEEEKNQGGLTACDML